MAGLLTLRQLRPCKANLFQYNYTPKYTPPPELATQFRELHPLAVRNDAIYQQRPKTGLWYWCKAKTTISPKRLPRSQARRKLMLAFQDSLRAHHLDERGLAQESAEVARLQRDFVLRSLDQEPAPIDLRGTLHLVPYTSILEAKSEEIREQTARLVRYLMRYQWLTSGLERRVVGAQLDAERQAAPLNSADGAMMDPVRELQSWEQFL